MNNAELISQEEIVLEETSQAAIERAVDEIGFTNFKNFVIVTNQKNRKSKQYIQGINSKLDEILDKIEKAWLDVDCIETKKYKKTRFYASSRVFVYEVIDDYKVERFDLIFEDGLGLGYNNPLIMSKYIIRRFYEEAGEPCPKVAI